MIWRNWLWITFTLFGIVLVMLFSGTILIGIGILLLKTHWILAMLYTILLTCSIVAAVIALPGE